MKYLFTAFSVALAIGASFFGLQAALYWRKASEISIDPGWNSGRPGDARAPQPADLEGTGTTDGFLSATMDTVRQGSALNKKAARFTAYSVAFAGFSSLSGALASLL